MRNDLLEYFVNKLVALTVVCGAPMTSQDRFDRPNLAPFVLDLRMVSAFTIVHRYARPAYKQPRRSSQWSPCVRAVLASQNSVQKTVRTFPSYIALALKRR